jgi:hypothetical protein
MRCALVLTSLECPSNRIDTENAYFCAVLVDLDAYERLGDLDKRFERSAKDVRRQQDRQRLRPRSLCRGNGLVQTYDGLEVHRRSRRFVSGARKYSLAGTTSGSAVLAWE